jgi:putative ABC transport system permease protein
MTFKDIALKNLWRRKNKAAFILSGLVIGVATVVAVITFADTMAHDISHKLEKYGANILIIPRTDTLTLSYGGVAMGGVSYEMQPIRHDQLDQIHGIKNAANIAAVGPVTLGSVRINDQTALLTGIDFKAARILKPWWKINGETPHDAGLLLGIEASRQLNLQTGRKLTINGHLLTVTGILEPTGSQDDQLVFARLQTAQRVLNKTGQVSLVEIAALCKDCPIEDMVAQIAEKIPTAKVMAIQQVVKGRMETLAQFKKFSYGLSVIVVLIGGLVVLVTLMGSVKERTEEIGIFRAIGFRQRHIMGIIFYETGLISLLAGLIGYSLGVGIIWAGIRLLSRHPQAVSLDPMLAGVAIAMAILVGLSASAYPAVTAARMDPNQALTAL